MKHEPLVQWAAGLCATIIWPSFYFTPINEGKWTWLGLQGACIAVFVIGVICAHNGIKRATKVLARG
jgi:hypothetical protein